MRPPFASAQGRLIRPTTGFRGVPPGTTARLTGVSFPTAPPARSSAIWSTAGANAPAAARFDKAGTIAADPVTLGGMARIKHMRHGDEKRQLVTGPVYRRGGQRPDPFHRPVGVAHAETQQRRGFSGMVAPKGSAGMASEYKGQGGLTPIP